MTETGRIRWQDDGLSGNYVGHVGTLAESAFQIYSPDSAHETWLLSVRVAAGSEFVYGGGLDELKAEAERWLEEFISSLGASFPEQYDRVASTLSGIRERGYRNGATGAECARMPERRGRIWYLCCQHCGSHGDHRDVRHGYPCGEPGCPGSVAHREGGW